MQQFDLIILGNGILGLSTALELTEAIPNIRIAVVGPASQDGSATLAAGAMLGYFGEITTMTLSSVYNRTILNLGINAAKMWPDWLAKLNQYLPEKQRVHTHPGTFIISNTESSKYENDNVDAILTALAEYNEPFEQVDPNNIPGLTPTDRCRPLKSIFLPNEGAINPKKLLTAMSTVLQQKNVTFLYETAVDFSCASAKIKHIVTNTGTMLAADTVLIAAGAYSQTLINKIPDLAERIPKIFAGLGCSIILNNTKNKIPLRTVIRSPNRAGACGIHALPCDNQANQLYIGATNTGLLSPHTEPRIRDIYYLLKRAMEQINHNFHNKSMSKYLVGNRPITMDTFPLIGHTSIDNLWISTGTYRNGLQLAPLLAKFLVNRMISPDTYHDDCNLSMFAPERGLITTLSKKQAIDEFVKQCFGTAYEHAMVLPKLGWESVMIEAFYKRVEDIYDKLETNIGIHPHILLMLEQNRDFIPIVKQYLKKENTITCNNLAVV